MSDKFENLSVFLSMDVSKWKAAFKPLNSTINEKINMLLEFARTTPFSAASIIALYNEWEDMDIVKTICSSSVVSAQSLPVMSSSIDRVYRQLDIDNYRAIAELQLLLIGMNHIKF
jgi:hypothetical protein